MFCLLFFFSHCIFFLFSLVIGSPVGTRTYTLHTLCTVLYCDVTWCNVFNRIDNSAVATDPASPKVGFQLTEGFSTNPTKVRIHPSSVLGKIDRGVPYIIYQERTISRREDRYVKCVSEVTQKQLLDAKENSVDEATFQAFKMQLKQMTRQSYPIKFKANKYEIKAITANLKDVQSEFPHAIIPGPKEIEKVKGKKPKNKKYVTNIKCSRLYKKPLRAAVLDAINCAMDQEIEFDVGK